MNLFSYAHLHTELVLQLEYLSTEVSFKCHLLSKLDIGVEGWCGRPLYCANN